MPGAGPPAPKPPSCRASLARPPHSLTYQVPQLAGAGTCRHLAGAVAADQPPEERLQELVQLRLEGLHTRRAAASTRTAFAPQGEGGARQARQND